MIEGLTNYERLPGRSLTYYDAVLTYYDTTGTIIV
jgi:hypothetical protein